MNTNLAQSLMNLNNYQQQKDESKLILYKKNNFKVKINPISSPQDFPFQKCYIIQENNFKKLMKEYNKFKGANINAINATTIMSSSSNSLQIKLDMNTIINLKDFYIVNKEFLNYAGKEKILYEQQNIYFYKKENKIYLLFPEETNEKNILEIIDLTNKDNNICLNKIPENSKENDINYQKEKIFKKCLLLTAFENDLFKLMEKPIDDLYDDIKEYYLINQNWLNIYKSNYTNLFNQINQIIFLGLKRIQKDVLIYYYYYYRFDYNSALYDLHL